MGVRSYSCPKDWMILSCSGSQEPIINTKTGGGKLGILRSCRKTIQSAYLIRNFPSNNFAFRDRFHIPNGLRDMWV